MIVADRARRRRRHFSSDPSRKRMSEALHTRTRCAYQLRATAVSDTNPRKEKKQAEEEEGEPIVPTWPKFAFCLVPLTAMR
eukprot:1786134-Rhodomonas_salina.2